MKMKFFLALIITANVLFFCLVSTTGCSRQSPTVVAPPTPTPYVTFRISNNSNNYITGYYDYYLHYYYTTYHLGTQAVTSVRVQWMWPVTASSSVKTCSIPYGSTQDVTVPMLGNDKYLCNVTIMNEYGSQDSWESFYLQSGSIYTVKIDGVSLSTLDSVFTTAIASF